MVFIPVKASMLGGKPSFPFDNRHQGGMGRTSIEVNLLSRTLFGISSAKPKVRSKKMSPTDPIEEEEKVKAEVEAEPKSEKEEENLESLRPRTSVIHTCYRAVLLSLMIILIRWVTQVFQPSLV
jgi:hypothetical protein